MNNGFFTSAADLENRQNCPSCKKRMHYGEPRSKEEVFHWKCECGEIVPVIEEDESERQFRGIPSHSTFSMLQAEETGISIDTSTEPANIEL
jgi:hypothetical protein